MKNAEVLERLEKVATLVIDKTGTLTEGKLKLTDILAADGFDAKDFPQGWPPPWNKAANILSQPPS